MSREEDSNLLSDWIQKRLAAYRQQATEFGQWPQATDPLMVHLTQTAHTSNFDERDSDMLSLVVSDALSGIDIAQRYPAFYERMVITPWLYQGFLDALEMLEADSADSLVSLPQAANRDLAFLNEAPAQQPKVAQSEQGEWHITWQLLADQVRRLLFPSPDLAYRRATTLLEDESFIVLHDEVEISGQRLEVMLEAVRSVERSDILRLQVLVAPEGSRPLAAMQAFLSWGPYAETAVLDTYGRAQFPPLPLDAILDDSGQINAGNLQLVLTLPQAE